MKDGHDIRVVHQGPDLIGESPVWDTDTGTLFWVDTRAPRIQSLDAAGRHRSWPMPAGIGSFAFRQNGQGLVAALQTGFCFVDLRSGQVDPILDPEPERPGNRLNDGKCDRAGRFWCGSRDAAGTEPTGSLYRLDPDLSCRRMDTGFFISNGMAFTPDGRTMVFGDSTGETVFRYDLDPATGALANRSVFLDTRHLPWRVDGATFDEEGFYWCALVRDWSIGRFAPDGRLDRLVRLPVRYPTMCCFGGEGLDVMYVTSASLLLEEAERGTQPLAGAVFAIHGLGVRGLPADRFAG